VDDENLSGGVPLRGDATASGLLCLAYFLSTLIAVRAFRAGRTGGRPAATNFGGHLALLAALGVVWWAAGLRPVLLLAFVPVAGRAVVTALRPPSHLRALGMRELAVSLAFTAIAAAVLLGAPASYGR